MFEKELQKDQLESLMTRFNQAEEMIKHSSTVPTYIPKSFSEQFYLYKNGATYRLYIYVDSWKYVALT